MIFLILYAAFMTVAAIYSSRRCDVAEANLREAWSRVDVWRQTATDFSEQAKALAKELDLWRKHSGRMGADSDRSLS